MEEYQSKAWDILTDKERTALQLTLTYDKTSLEAAIVMNIYPYKFAEIQTRAKRFFLMFSSHFELYGELFPKDLIMDDGLKTYLESLILRRLTIKRAILQDPEFGLLRYPEKASIILEFMDYLQEEGYTDLRDLLIEFDRWNSFRVLPKKIQKISPFKRRQNKAFKKIFQAMTSQGEVQFRFIYEKARQTKPPLMFVPIITTFTQDPVNILEFPRNEFFKDWLGKNKLPAFSSHGVATDMGLLVADYTTSKYKNSYLARKFWPEFKAYINKSLNVYSILDIKDFNQALEDMSLSKNLKRLKGHE